MNLDLWWIQILLNSHVWILNPKKRHSQRCHFLFTKHKGGSDLQFVDRAGLVSSPILRNKLLRRERREAFAVFTSCQRNFQGLVFIPKSKPANNSRSSDKCPVNFSFSPAKVYPGRTLWPCIGHFRNVRGLGKSMVVFRLFEKLKYSNERSTIF